tara:strand:+ start:1123 stop:1371 length:249 start_codon:yes stop_codon:yes gene_type:complete
MEQMDQKSMDEDIIQLYLMADYLKKRGKTQWSDLIHGIVIYIEEKEEDEDDSDYNYSEDEGNAVKEEKPRVIKSDDGHQRLY